ncbi:FliM/FliN family flagellar motor switch protein [Paracoccus sp. IB05]|uniref:FliM/FliN family flagellar motor switch protein n=1 Tax=Paracoccus sp. IB05 TaxID=2779367 RepID=UPI0018E71AA9|nr:FliM/FliN family flagellar motor switch protein [Paracoccus sp. IB05]MBJ2151688.1 FliM/FliN family flagellar motor switch protein [Paracoccus sp. IB05]
MSEILRRKLRPAHDEQARPHALVDQAWRLALARALREGAGLPAETTALTSRPCDLVELPELPAERALIALLDGPGGAMGVAALSPELTASLIEMQTIGRIGAGPPGPRRPTRTDAAMISPVLDRALARFDFLVRDLPDRRVEAGFRFASQLDDARSIGLLLDDQPYHLMSATLSLADGKRSGEILLALPLTGPTVALTQSSASGSEGFAADLGQTECELQAVLGRRMLTLNEVMQLEPGQLLALNDASIAKISLHGIDGRAVAAARLGQQNGYRALRISTVATPRGEVEACGPDMAAGQDPPSETSVGSLDFPAGFPMEQGPVAQGTAPDPGFGLDAGLGEGFNVRVPA